jgi:hypothetical protein
MGTSYWELVEPVWLRLNSAWHPYDPHEFLQEFHAVPREVGHLYAAHWCHSEVCNGGLRQFFWNSTGLLAPESRDGFRGIGIAELSDVLDAALEHFGDPYERDKGEREAMLEIEEWRGNDLVDALAVLSERFFNAADTWEPAADAYAERFARRNRA